MVHISRACQSFYGPSLSFPFLLSHFLLFTTIRSDRVILILALRATAVLLCVEQPRICVVILLDVLM